jgi:hypothetical protein
MMITSGLGIRGGSVLSTWREKPVTEPPCGQQDRSYTFSSEGSGQSTGFDSSDVPPSGRSPKASSLSWQYQEKQGKIESWAGIDSIGVHPGARVNCLNLLPHGIMATHKAIFSMMKSTTCCPKGFTPPMNWTAFFPFWILPASR